MVYVRLTLMSLTAAAVLALALVLPGLPQSTQGFDPELARAYANHRRILVETDVITGVNAEGDRLLVGPGPRWYELSEEVQRLHVHVLAEGLLGHRDAPWRVGLRQG